MAVVGSSGLDNVLKAFVFMSASERLLLSISFRQLKLIVKFIGGIMLLEEVLGG